MHFVAVLASGQPIEELDYTNIGVIGLIRLFHTIKVEGLYFKTSRSMIIKLLKTFLQKALLWRTDFYLKTEVKKCIDLE